MIFSNNSHMVSELNRSIIFLPPTLSSSSRHRHQQTGPFHQAICVLLLVRISDQSPPISPSLANDYTPSDPLPISMMINMTRIKLSSANYLMWCLQARHMAVCFDVMGHLDGFTPPPSPTVASDAGVQYPNSAYMAKRLMDKKLFSIPYTSLTEDFVQRPLTSQLLVQHGLRLSRPSPLPRWLINSVRSYFLFAEEIYL